MKHNPAASDTTGRTLPKNLRIEFYDENGDNDPRVERLAETAWKIAQASPIRILSNKRLSAIAVLGRKVVGAAWTSVDQAYSDDEPSQFSFDVVVAPEAQGKGVGDALVGEMLDQFRHLAPTYGDDEMGGGLVLNVEVVNPAMERILARRGFRLRGEEDPLAARGRTMMTRPNGRGVLRPNGRRPNPPPEGRSLAGGIFAGMDLRHMVLTGANLQGADLSGANLAGVNLDDAVLDSANLDGADLTGASLKNASLEDVRMSEANLTGADLGGAILSRGRLRSTNFSRANLREADLYRAEATEANFSEAYLTYTQMLMVVATDADFAHAVLTGMTGMQGTFTRARFESAIGGQVDFSAARLVEANFSGAELREVKFNDADLTGASLDKAAVLDNVSVVNAKMDPATRALFFVDRSAYGKMSGPILKMDKPDAPTKAAEFKKKYPREFERLKAETGGRDLLPAVKEAIRAKYRSARPWIITRGYYTGNMQRYCGSPNAVLKFNIALDDASFTPAQQDSLRKLAETSRRSGHPHELGDLFTIGWVRYCPDEAERTWLVEEVQSDVSVVRQQLKDEKEFPQQFREVVDILAPIAERFYYDALGVVFELVAEKGYEVEMLDYPAKKEMGSPRSVYTDLPREMGMQKKPKSALEEGAVEGVGAVWAYRPNPKSRRGGRK